MRTSLDPKLVDQAKTVEVFAWIAAVTLGVQVLTLLGLLNLIGPIADRDGQGVHDVFVQLAPRLVGLIPAFCYFTGVLAAARIFGRVSKGELFSEANAGGLSEVGSSLLWGAIASALIVPAIQSFIAHEHPFFGLRAEPEVWVLAVIGGAIMVLGRMMRHGMRLQGELDEII
jgi:hypothetical protein